MYNNHLQIHAEQQKDSQRNFEKAQLIEIARQNKAAQSHHPLRMLAGRGLIAIGQSLLPEDER